MTRLTPEEIEVRVGEFLDTLPLELSRGQRAMLYLRLCTFAEWMQPAEAVAEKPKKKRRFKPETLARLRADPVRMERLRAIAAKGRAILAAKALLRKNGAAA